jgi:hypothetical protein
VQLVARRVTRIASVTPARSLAPISGPLNSGRIEAQFNLLSLKFVWIILFANRYLR